MSIRAGLAHQKERQRLREAAERDDTDGASLQILEAVDLGDPIRGNRQRQQRQPGGRAEPFDFRATVDSFDDIIERRRGIINCAADQRLRCRRTAAHIDEFDVEPLIAEIPAFPGDLKGRDTQNRAAEAS